MINFYGIKKFFILIEFYDCFHDQSLTPSNIQPDKVDRFEIKRFKISIRKIHV